MALNEKDHELINAFMEHVYRLKDTKTVFWIPLNLFPKDEELPETVGG